jgi:hypothetical protein
MTCHFERSFVCSKMLNVFALKKSQETENNSACLPQAKRKVQKLNVKSFLLIFVFLAFFAA